MGFLDIKRATKSYGAVKILHETDISVEEGEFLVLVGPSGCGKSTLLNMIAGPLRWRAGMGVFCACCGACGVIAPARLP